MSEFAIPDCWKVVELGEVSFVTKLAGFEYTDYFDYSIGGEIIAVRCLNIRNGRLCLDAVQTIPRSVSNKLPRSKLQRGDLVISYVGTIGEVAAIPSNNRFHLAPNVARVVLEPEHVDSSFVVQQMLADDCQNRISLLTASTTQAAISMTRLRTLKLITPPLPEQRKIARILTTLDNLIEKTEALIAKYQSIKQGMMHDLFTRGVDAHGRLRPTHEQAPDLYKQSELGWIPKEWDDQKSLGENIDFITDYRGKTPPTSNEGIPVISAETVGDGYLKDTTKRVSEQTYRAWTTRGFPEPGDVIFTTEAPVGAIAALPADQTYLLTRRVIALRPYEDNLKKRYLHWRMILEGQSSTWLKYQHGSTVPRILKPDLLNHTFPLPNPEEQVEVGTRLDACQSKIDSERAALAKYKLQKSGLMQDLLTGKVRVKVG